MNEQPNNQKQPTATEPSIAETVSSLMQLFPSRDEVKTIAEDAVPAELLRLDSTSGSGGDVLLRGKAAVNSSPPTAFWGKAVMALKYLTTYLTGKIEIKASTGIEITPDATAGSESLTFKNTGMTSLNGCTGAVNLLPGEGITGEVNTTAKTLTITNDGVTTLASNHSGITLSASKGDVVVGADPKKLTPTGYLLTNLYFVDAGSGQKNLYADGVGSGDYYGQLATGYLVPGGPVGGGGGSSSGYSGQITMYGQAYISGTNLVQDKFTWTFNNGALASVATAGTVTIATLLSCDT